MELSKNAINAALMAKSLSTFLVSPEAPPITVDALQGKRRRQGRGRAKGQHITEHVLDDSMHQLTGFSSFV